jgi:hypothetical protein
MGLECFCNLPLDYTFTRLSSASFVQRLCLQVFHICRIVSWKIFFNCLDVEINFLVCISVEPSVLLSSIVIYGRKLV